MTWLCAALAFQTPASFDFDVQPGTGLAVSVQGIPVIRGSLFQYYEPDWSKGYYSSSKDEQQVKQIDAETLEMDFKSSHWPVSGSQTFHRQGDILKVSYRFEWGGEHPVKVEVGAGLLWASAFAQGVLAPAGQTLSAPKLIDPNPKLQDTARRLLPDTNSVLFSTPFMDMSVSGSQPLFLFDARGYDQPWAQGRQLWWLGDASLDVAKGAPATLEVDWRFTPKGVSPARNEIRELPRHLSQTVLAPVEELPALIPQPKVNQLDFTKPLVLTGKYAFPAGKFRGWNLFLTALDRRYRKLQPEGAPVNIDGGQAKLGLKPGGYRIILNSVSISVLGQDDDGLRNAMNRLAALAFVEHGKLALPTGTILDEPQTSWRGVHLFVGPNSIRFQKKLWERVLLPLGFNKVVLQCERTDWKTLPGTETSITMQRDDLKRLFEWYRSQSVEPIPLIESFGHMEWFFANGRNRDLAYDPAEPYTLDVRKPQARQKLQALWDEVYDLLKPSTMHFGCDEVDLHGFGPNDTDVVTQMWEQHIPFLAQIAAAHHSQMMIWGDQALTAGEAPDAALAPTAEAAVRRRAAIPKGTTVADWHYEPDPNPAVFYPTLQLWKNAGIQPIATAWFSPVNIQGFNLAAVLEQCGTLQTTWAGYESSEQGMLENLPQFSAMVVAADYSWSGRQDAPDKLGYDPAVVFRKMYFDGPQPIRQVIGVSFADSPSKKVQAGANVFLIGDPVLLRSVLLPGQSSSPTSVEIPIGLSVSHLALAIDTATPLDFGDSCGLAEVDFADGRLETVPIVYGRNIAAGSDSSVLPESARSDGISALEFNFDAKEQVTRIRLSCDAAQRSGMRLYALNAS